MGLPHAAHSRDAAKQQPVTSRGAEQQRFWPAAAQMQPRRLCHLHLGRTAYAHAGTLQSNIVAAFLASKAKADANVAAPPPPPPPPPPPLPTIITSEFNPPVYTLGRRERNTLSESQLANLSWGGRAEVHEALRGGQTTFHGPGQLTAYAIVDLRSHGLTPRCYIRMLENTVITVLEKYGIKAFTTDDPGVWTSPTHKIAAVGVHMRRNITSHGIGLNVSTDLAWFDRIVACGLEGKKTTSMQAEGVEASVEEVGSRWVETMAEVLKCPQIKYQNREGG